MTRNPFRAERPDHKEVLRFLAGCSEDYPSFSDWYLSSIIAGLLTGERLMRSVREDGRLIALSILKRSRAEKKICCLRVGKDARGKGLAAYALRDASKALGMPAPLITVSERRRPQFAKLLAGAGFVQTAEVEGLYIPGRKEFIYNGGDVIV